MLRKLRTARVPGTDPLATLGGCLCSYWRSSLWPPHLIFLSLLVIQPRMPQKLSLTSLPPHNPGCHARHAFTLRSTGQSIHSLPPPLLPQLLPLLLGPAVSLPLSQPPARKASFSSPLSTQPEITTIFLDAL